MKISIFTLTEKENNILDQKFRKDQIFDFVINKFIKDFDQITNLPKDLRKELKEKYALFSFSLTKKQVSKDGTVKYLFKLQDGSYIESVILKDNKNRMTFCISTQSGCKMGCIFCKTGEMGLIKNLTYDEIISQVLYLSYEVRKNYNIVFMGMGEPLDNYKDLCKSIDILKDKNIFGISPSRISISTCGITDKILPILDKFPKINIAVSLNSAVQEKRKKIMPISKKYPIDELIKTLEKAYSIYKNRITLEYVLIKNINIGIDEINELSKLKKNIFIINVIPINNNDNINLKKPDEKEIKTFCELLKNKGFNVTRRYRRGDDIKAGCGQLYWKSIYKK